MSRVLFIEWGEQGNLIRSTIVDTSETDAFYVPKTMMEADLNVHRVTFYREADSLGRGGWEYENSNGIPVRINGATVILDEEAYERWRNRRLDVQ